jgi:hypothetical protein
MDIAYNVLTTVQHLVIILLFNLSPGSYDAVLQYSVTESNGTVTTV